MQSPPAETQSPPIENFLATVLLVQFIQHNAWKYALYGFIIL